MAQPNRNPTDFCSRCGFLKEIVHTGQVPRTPPFKGFNEVRFCKGCYDAVKLGRETLDSLAFTLLGEPGAAVTEFDQYGIPVRSKSLSPDVEIKLLNLRMKMTWAMVGFVAGIFIGVAFMMLLWLRPAP